MTELLTVGGYGCIYKPSIGCDGKNTKNDNYISSYK